MQWKQSSFSRPKKKSVGKVTVMIFSFLEKESIPMTDYFQKNQTINVDYYSKLLCRLKDMLKENRWVRLPEGVLFL